MNTSEFKWVQVNTNEYNWVQVSTSEYKWIHFFIHFLWFLAWVFFLMNVGSFRWVIGYLIMNLQKFPKKSVKLTFLFTCHQLYSLVLTCIHLYSLVLTWIQLNSFLFILIGLIGFYDSLTHQKVSQTCSHTKKNVKSMEKFISVHYLKSGENQSSIWHSGESQCNFKSWPILRRCNASEQVSKN